MNYEDKKIVGIIASKVDLSTALNVIGHLAISIGKYSEKEIMGKPFITTKVKATKLKCAIDKARENPNLLVADYPIDMLETRTDEDLIKAVEAKENNELEYFGNKIECFT